MVGAGPGSCRKKMNVWSLDWTGQGPVGKSKGLEDGLDGALSMKVKGWSRAGRARPNDGAS